LRLQGPVAFLLIAAAFAVYAQVRDHDFVHYDDGLYIIQNPNLRAPLGLESVRRAFTTPYETNWIPLTWISLHVDYTLYGLEPAGYHLTNVALHALSAVLLFFALSRMTQSTGASAFVAAVFALHPLHVESVAWAAERKDVLSGVFWMLTLLAYGEYARRPPSVRRYAVVFLCLALGLLAKPMGVTLPCVLLLLDYWPLGRLRVDLARALPDGRLFRRAIIEKLPMLLLVATVSAITYAVQREMGAMSREPMLPFPFRLMNAIDSYGAYIAQSFWPTGLAVFYPHPLRNVSPFQTGALALGLAAATAAVARVAAARPYLIVGWLWYLGTLVPVIGLVQAGMQARADRYTYIPQVGLCIMLAWGALDVAGRRHARRLALTATACAATVALATVSSRQVSHWRDTTALFERAIAVTEGNFVAQHVLAGERLRVGRLEEAGQLYSEALRLKPHWADAEIGLGNVLLEQGDIPAAIERYQSALRLDRHSARALERLGHAWLEAGKPTQAARPLRRALRLEHWNAASRDQLLPRIHGLLAQALAERGDWPESIEHYRMAIELRPGFAEAHANLGFALAQVERSEDARRHLEHALSLGLESAEVHVALGMLALQRRDGEPAVRHLREGLRLRPDQPSAANNLAWLLATSPSERIRNAEESIRIAEPMAATVKDDRSAVLDTLAAAYAAAGRFEAAIRTASEAAAVAREDDDGALAKDIEMRLALYRSHRAYIGPSPLAQD
jgi:tetratricopeptide (TPR) repeat protein